MNLDIEKIIREHIDKTFHMSLATVENNKPWVCEVHFVYDNDLNLYFRSQPNRRHSIEISKNPYVAGNIVKQHPLEEYPHAIYFEGTAELLKDPNDHQKIFSLFKDRLKSTEEILSDALKDDGHKFFKISVNNWYAFGKFGGDKGLKHKLAWHQSTNE